MDAGRLAMLVVGVGCGAFLLLKGMSAGELRVLDVDAFHEGGGVYKKTLYAEVSGYPVGEVVEVRESGRGPVLYVPLGRKLHDTAAVRVVIEVELDSVETHVVEDEETGAVSARGLVDKGMAGDLRGYFERKAGTDVASTVWLVKTGDEPASTAKVGIITILGTLVLVPLTALFDRRE